MRADWPNTACLHRTQHRRCLQKGFGLIDCYYRKYLNSDLQPFRPPTFVLFPVHSRSGLLPHTHRLSSSILTSTTKWRHERVQWFDQRETPKQCQINIYYIHGVIFSPSQNKGVGSWFPCPPVGAFHYITIPLQALCKWFGKPNTNVM